MFIFEKKVLNINLNCRREIDKKKQLHLSRLYTFRKNVKKNVHNWKFFFSSYNNWNSISHIAIFNWANLEILEKKITRLCLML